MHPSQSLCFFHPQITYEDDLNAYEEDNLPQYQEIVQPLKCTHLQITDEGDFNANEEENQVY